MAAPRASVNGGLGSHPSKAEPELQTATTVSENVMPLTSLLLQEAFVGIQAS